MDDKRAKDKDTAPTIPSGSVRPADEPRIPTADHPVGATAGALTGAVVGGAAAGSVAGPIGAAVGAAVGAAAGGLAGKGVADLIDPQAEDRHWREAWRNRSYIEGGYTYDQDYGPAYRYGVDAATRHPGRRWEDVDAELGQGWAGVRGDSRLGWERARPACRDAWDRVSEARREPPREAGRERR